MKKTILITFLLISSLLAEDTWRYKGKEISINCFKHQDLFVKSYPEFYNRKFGISLENENDFVENPGKYFFGTPKKYITSLDTYGTAIMPISNCLMKTNSSNLWYQLRKKIPLSLCNKLVPNLNAKCKEAYYLIINNPDGGRLNRGHMYYYGIFESRGKDYLVPLKRFTHYKDAERLLKKSINSAKYVKLENDHNVLLLDVDYELDGNQLLLYVSSKNLLGNSKGGISISIPEFSTTKRIVNKKSKGFKNITAYKKGKKLWNREIKKTVRNKYLLLEGWSTKWRTNEEKAIKLIIDISGLNSLDIHVRSNIIKDKKEYVNPKKSTFYNQQGYYDRVLNISLR